MEIARKPYPSDVSDEEWALIAPYLTLLPEDAGQRDYPLREAFNGLRYIIKTGAQWRAMPHDLPPWAAVYQQARPGVGLFRGAAGRPARGAARGSGPFSRSKCRHHRRPHPAVLAGKRRAC